MTPTTEPVKILLVDDRPEGLFTLETVLKCPEYELVKAESGEQALKRLLDEDFALVLLDVQMPGMDGFETAHLIRERKRSRHVPIIFVTAINKDDSFVGRGYEAGAVDYIFKPFNPDILRSKVAVFVDLFRKKSQLLAHEAFMREEERREQEQRLLKEKLDNMRRYENLANSIPHMLWRARNDGQMEYFNKVWLDYTGQSQERAIQGAWKLCIHPKDQSKVLEVWNKAIQEDLPHFGLECRILDRDGGANWFWVRALAEKNAQGQTISWIGTNTDIKEKKELEKQKASFLSIASHELKTPLTAIKTSLEAAQYLMEDSELAPEDIASMREFLKIGSESSDRMDELLEEFLDFSRVESARMSIKPAMNNFSDIVANSIETHLPKINRSGRLTLKADISKEVKAMVDGARIRQVVDNLIGNAIKYTPGEGEIAIGLRACEKFAWLSVADQGVGIDKCHLNKIFKPFKRVSENEAISGLGIGLYISNWIVEEHHGKILVESEKGKGSCFTLKLPLGGVDA